MSINHSVKRVWVLQYKYKPVSNASWRDLRSFDTLEKMYAALDTGKYTKRSFFYRIITRTIVSVDDFFFDSDYSWEGTQE